MKRALNAVWVFLIIIFVYFLINYTINEIAISKYNNGTYDENTFTLPLTGEKYVSLYNKGNNYYQNGKYSEAIDEYKKALDENPPKYKECMIRINIALSMVTPIDPDEITDENIDDTINILEEAKKVLIEDGCADKNNNGHSEDAQKLKNDIDEFEDELKSKTSSGKKDDGDDDDDDSDDDDDDNGNNNEIKDKLQNLQNQGTIDRNSALEEVKNLNNFNYYSGKGW